VGRTLLAVGALALLLPVVAALVAHLRGRSRAAGWFVVLTLLAVVPAAVAINRGASEMRQANEADSPASEPCGIQRRRHEVPRRLARLLPPSPLGGGDGSALGNA